MDVIDLSISHVYREGNSLADFLAKCGSDGLDDFFQSKFDLPKEAVGIWNMDKSGLGSFKQPK